MSMNVPGQHRGKGRGAWGLSGGLATRRPVAHHEQQLRNTAITKRKRNHISFFYEKLRNYGNERKVRILAADFGGSVTSTIFTERLGGWRASKLMPRSRRIRALFRGAAVHDLSGLRAALVSGGSCKLRVKPAIRGP